MTDETRTYRALMRIESTLARIEAKLDTLFAVLQCRMEAIMADLTALEAQVKENTTVEGSAIVLIKGLADQLAAAGTDPAKLAALQSQMKASADALAAAVAANTQPPPAPPAAG